MHGRMEIVKILLARGVDVNGGDFDNWRALHECAHHDHWRIAELLIDS